jgi:hypothetical protein
VLKGLHKSGAVKGLNTDARNDISRNHKQTKNLMPLNEWRGRTKNIMPLHESLRRNETTKIIASTSREE